MNIAVLGSGNIGTLLAGKLTLNGHLVKLYSRKPELFDKNIYLNDLDRSEISKVHISLVSSDLEQVLKNCDLAIICIPAFAIQELMEKVFKMISIQTRILFYPGTGGVEYYCKKFIDQGGIIFGTQRVCSVARLETYGKSVSTSGKRDHMYVSSIPNEYGYEIKKFIEEEFDIPTTILPNYLSVTLTPSNPILHTSRLYTIFKDYSKNHEGYEKLPLFYEEWDMESSELLIDIDQELQCLCGKIDMDLSQVKSLLEHYESKNAEEMTRKICSIKSLKGLLTPFITKKGKYHPDFESRYFTADFPYGLMIIKSIALLFQLRTPNIDLVLQWYQGTCCKEYITETGKLGHDSKELSIPQNYDLYDQHSFTMFYKI